MDTYQLLKALKRVEKFNGVYPRDLLVNSKFQPGGYIVNTDRSDSPGEHWVALFFDRQGRGEYFDSYGLPPIHDEIIEFLETNSGKRWTYNTQQLQMIASVSCGYFCYLYIMFRCNGLSLEDFQDFVTERSSVNEILLNYYRCIFLPSS